jgi:hypothetical protein
MWNLLMLFESLYGIMSAGHFFATWGSTPA